MGYEISITRNPPLELSEWKSAVQATSYGRLDSGGTSITNPDTAEVITMKGRDGDAMIPVKGQGEWLFRWRSDGEVVFAASDDFENPHDPVRAVARSLAGRLGAMLVGEGGEHYE